MDLAEDLKRRRKLAQEKQQAEDDDKKRYKWDFASHGYEVFYVDAAGQKHRSVKGLHVAREGALGEVLSAETIRANRLAMETKAKKMWNELDHSKRPRFTFQTPATP